jgi:hypothetical protein
MINLYLVKLNWYGEVHEFYSHGNSELQAKYYAIKKLTKKTDYTFKYVRDYFGGNNSRENQVSIELISRKGM